MYIFEIVLTFFFFRNGHNQVLAKNTYAPVYC